MQFEDLRRQWNAFGEQDPYWAILTDADKAGGRWDPAAFFATGREEIANMLNVVESDRPGFLASHSRRALDFGCGAGRLSQGLAEHFQEVDGVDIARSMIELARERNQHGDRVRYHLNEAEDLSLFPEGAFDFIYTRLVLQHMRPEYAAGYITEFMRLLAPGGIAMFQVPSSRREVVAPEAGPMPLSAFRAWLGVPALDVRFAVGEQVSVPVTVRNLSQETWPGAACAVGQNPINVGNHWFAIDGTMIARDDGRSLIEETVPPGGLATVCLPVTAPSQPGPYMLDIDLVQENVCWFELRGFTRPVRIFVEVVDQLDEDSRGRDLFKPIMQVWGMAREAVESIVTQTGRRLVAVHDDGSCGPSWESFLYVVERP